MKTRKSVAAALPANTPKPRPMTDIPSVAALRAKVIEFENAGYRLLSDLSEASRIWSRFGKPKPIDFPAFADRRYAMDESIRATFESKGEECPALPRSAWSEFLEDFPEIYGSVLRSAEGALTMSPSVEFVIDQPDTPVTQRLIPQLNGAIRSARMHIHPGAFGDDGMGFFRNEGIQVPQRFAEDLLEVVRLRVLLEAAQQPPRLRWPTGATAKVLKEVGRIGNTTFIEMCERAGVERGGSGSHAHRFQRPSIRKLIAVGRASTSQKWNDAAESWAQEFGFESGG